MEYKTNIIWILLLLFLIAIPALVLGSYATAMINKKFDFRVVNAFQAVGGDPTKLSFHPDVISLGRKYANLPTKIMNKTADYNGPSVAGLLYVSQDGNTVSDTLLTSYQITPATLTQISNYTGTDKISLMDKIIDPSCENAKFETTGTAFGNQRNDLLNSKLLYHDQLKTKIGKKIILPSVPGENQAVQATSNLVQELINVF